MRPPDSGHVDEVAAVVSRRVPLQYVDSMEERGGRETLLSNSVPFLYSRNTHTIAFFSPLREIDAAANLV